MAREGDHRHHTEGVAAQRALADFQHRLDRGCDDRGLHAQQSGLHGRHIRAPGIELRENEDQQRARQNEQHAGNRATRKAM